MRLARDRKAAAQSRLFAEAVIHTADSHETLASLVVEVNGRTPQDAHCDWEDECPIYSGRIPAALRRGAGRSTAYCLSDGGRRGRRHRATAGIIAALAASANGALTTPASALAECAGPGVAIEEAMPPRTILYFYVGNQPHNVG